MSDKKQLVIPPGAGRLTATTPPRKPSLPSLPTGNAWLGPAHSVYDRNRRTVEASANYMRARADQAAACIELIQKRDDLAMAIARLDSLPERCAHAYEKERLGRLSERRVLQLQHELDETNAKIALASAHLQLAQYLPQPVAPAPSASAPGLTPADVEKVAQTMPELKPETIQSLIWALAGFLSEKNK